MNKIIFLLGVLLFFASCKKDGFSSSPEVSFTSLTPNTWTVNNLDLNTPVLTFQLKDAEGDFTSNDSVFVKAMFTGQLPGNCSVIDTSLVKAFLFPDVPSNNSNMEAEISVNINKLIPFIRGYHCYSDTINFQFYVKDHAGHQSNIAQTSDFYYIVP